MKMKDNLSALLDGELDQHDAERVLTSLRSETPLERQWAEYCLIGDLLRGEQYRSADFTQRVMAELEDDVVILAPRSHAHARPDSPSSQWLRGLMPIAASVMGVAIVGWVAYTLSLSEPNASFVATAEPVQRQASAVVPVTNVNEGNEHLEYVFVHQAMNGGGPIPGAIQYVRTVSDSSGERQR